MKLQIKYKLFLAMLLANLLIVVGGWVLVSLSFNNSFRGYLDANQEKRLLPLMVALEARYQEENNWNWLKGRKRYEWRTLLEQHLFPRFHTSKRNGARGERFPPRPKSGPRKRLAPHQEFRPMPQNPMGDPFEMRPTIFLMDRDRNIIIGPSSLVNEEVNWLSLKNDQLTIGFVGYHRTQEISSDLDNLFIHKLKENLTWSLLLIFGVSALITIELARRLTKPILSLRGATNHLASGDYSATIEIHSNDELGDLARDFNQLVETLKRNQLARQQWIADISHELRTPIAVLRAELEAVQDGIRTLDMTTIHSLHQEVLRLTRLIDDLHDLSLSDSGAMTYRFEMIRPIAVIEDVIKSEQSIIRQKDFTIKLTNSQHLAGLKVFADANRLNQLFSNLLRNSLVYTDSGGIIEIIFAVEKEHILIHWRDSAPSVTDEQLGKLFERLYRVEISRNRNSGGSGLGLSICKNIVEAHKGSIVAEHSSLGGVEFVIRLPLGDRK